MNTIYEYTQKTKQVNDLANLNDIYPNHNDTEYVIDDELKRRIIEHGPAFRSVSPSLDIRSSDFMERVTRSSNESAYSQDFVCKDRSRNLPLAMDLTSHCPIHESFYAWVSTHSNEIYVSDLAMGIDVENFEDVKERRLNKKGIFFPPDLTESSIPSSKNISEKVKTERPSRTKRRSRRSLRNQIVKDCNAQVFGKGIHPQIGLGTIGLDEDTTELIKTLIEAFRTGTEVHHVVDEEATDTLRTIGDNFSHGLNVNHSLDGITSRSAESVASAMSALSHSTVSVETDIGLKRLCSSIAKRMFGPESDVTELAIFVGGVVFLISFARVSKTNHNVKMICGAMSAFLLLRYYKDISRFLPWFTQEDIWDVEDIDSAHGDDDWERHENIIRPQAGAFSTHPIVHGLLGYIYYKAAGKGLETKDFTKFLSSIKDISKIKDSLEFSADWILELVRLFLSWMKNQFNIDIDYEGMFKHPEAVSFAKDVDSLLKEFDEGAAMDFENGKRIQEIMSRGRKLLIQLPNTKECQDGRAMVLSSMNFLKPVCASLERANIVGNGPRIEPFGLMLGGPPGAGKTTIATFMLIKIAAACLPKTSLPAYLRNHNDFVYNRITENVFFDGYHGQFITAFDDVGQNIDVAGQNDNAFMEVIRAINNNNYSLHMAHLEEKAGTNFVSRIVFATTNRRRFHNLACLYDEKAFTRRWKCKYWMLVKREYATAETQNLPKWIRKLDAKKVVKGNFDYAFFYRHDIDSGQSDESIELSVEDVVAECIESYKHIDKHGNDILEMHQLIKELAVAERYAADEAEALEKPETSVLNESTTTVEMESIEEFHDLPQEVAIHPQVGDRFPYENHPFNSQWRYEVSKIGQMTPGQWMDSDPERNTQISEVTLKRLADFVDSLKLSKFSTSTSELTIEAYKMMCDEYWTTYCNIYVDVFPALERYGKRWYVRQLTNTMLKYGLSLTTMKRMRQAASNDAMSENYKCFYYEFFALQKEIPGKYFWGEMVFVGSLRAMIDTINWRAVAGLTAAVATIGLGIRLFKKVVCPQSDYPMKQKREAKKSKKSGRSVRLRKGDTRPQGVLNPNTAAFATKVFRKNMYELRVQGVKLGYLVFVKGRVATIPTHFTHKMTQVEEDGQDRPDVVEIIRCGSPECKYYFGIGALRFFDFEDDLDLSFVVFPQTFPCAADISEYFTDNLYEEPNHFEGCLVVPRHGTMVDHVVSIRYIPELKYADFVNEHMYSYHVPTVTGDCGVPLFLCDQRTQKPVMLGIHVAGDGVSGYSLHVSHDRVKQVLDMVGVQVSVPMDSSDEIIPQIGGKFNVIKKMKAARRATDSKIIPSPLHGKWGASDYLPSKLRCFRSLTGETIDPMKNAREKYSRGNPVLNPTLLNDCTESVTHLVMQQYKREDQPWDARLFTYDEAIAGVSGVPHCEPLPRGTSPGYPLIFDIKKRGKRDFFGEGEEISFCGRLGEILLEDVQRIDSQIRQGIRTECIYMDCLKDERRPKEKVAIGKTRMFSSAPLAHTILFRKYFMDFTRFVAGNRIYNGIGIGMNPVSPEWQVITRKLLFIGQYLGAGDFSNYDGSIFSAVLYKCLDVIEAFYAPTADPEDVIARKVLFEELANSVHIIDGIVYEWSGSVPSGIFLTAMVDSLVNLILFRYASISCLLEHKDQVDPIVAVYNDYYRYLDNFEKCAYFICFGDDNMWSICADWIDYVNQHTLTGAYANLGMTYTDEEKSTGTVAKYRSINEVTFLKRAFVYDTKCLWMLAPLSIETILEAPYWTKDDCKTADVLQTLENMYYELSLHDSELFDKYGPLFIKHGGIIGFNPRHRSQEAARAHRLTMEVYY